MPETSVIILNWNGLHYLEKNLKSVFSQTYKDFEVLLVDNGSTDGSVKYIKKHFPRARLILHKKNLGFAEGVNSGIKKSKGNYIALLNNDAVAKKDWLNFLVETIKSNPDYACVSAASYNKYSGDYEFYAGTSGFFGQNSIFKNFKYPKNKIIPIFGMAGGACMFRNPHKPVFDLDYFAYSEDTAYGWLMRLKGYQNVLNANAVVYHEGEASGKRLGYKKIFLQERNRLLNILIYYHWFTLIKLIPLFLLNIISLTLADIKNFSPRMNARFWIIFNIPLILKKRSKIQSQRKLNDKQILRYMSCKFYEENNIKDPIFKAVVISLNKLQLAYCYILRIKTMEFYKN